MGVNTTSDDMRDDLVELLEKSSDLANKIVLQREWGWKEWSKEYQSKLMKAAHTLADLREQL